MKPVVPVEEYDNHNKTNVKEKCQWFKDMWKECDKYVSKEKCQDPAQFWWDKNCAKTCCVLSLALN